MQSCKTHGLAGETDLPGMLATFSSYENLLGPRHPLILSMLMEIGVALWRHRRMDEALIVLQRGLQDSTFALGRNHDLRLRLLAALRDLFAELGDIEKATAAQKELLQCNAERFGAEHAETFAARETLVEMLLRNPPSAAS